MTWRPANKPFHEPMIKPSNDAYMYASLGLSCLHITWWCHPMDPFSALLPICEGNPPVIGGFPSQRPVTRSFDVFFNLRLNKRLSKQSRHRWIETPSRSLWCKCYDMGWGREFGSTTAEVYFNFQTDWIWLETHTSLLPDLVKSVGISLSERRLKFLGAKIDRCIKMNDFIRYRHS